MTLFPNSLGLHSAFHTPHSALVTNSGLGALVETTTGTDFDVVGDGNLGTQTPRT